MITGVEKCKTLSVEHLVLSRWEGGLIPL